MRPLSFLLAASCLWAQSIALSVSPAQVKPGATVTLTLAYADSAPSAGLAGLEWGLLLPPGVTAASPALGPAAIAAGKVLTCGVSVCVLIGDGMPPNATAITSGVLVTVPLVVGNTAATGALSVTLTGLMGTTGPGLALPLNISTVVTVCRWKILLLKLVCS